MIVIPKKTRWFSIFVGLCLAFLTSAAQITITKRITIQPIQIRSTDGTTSVSNPNQILYEAETDKIWSQAGIDIQFLPMMTYDNSDFLSVSNSLFSSNSILGLSQLGGQPWSYGNGLPNTVVRLFFVKLLDGSANNLGYSQVSRLFVGIGNAIGVDQQTAMAVADRTFTLNRPDVIAHELGHLLGLDHTTQGAGGTLNLMTQGTSRTSPGSITDIFPNGVGTDQLTGSIGGTNWGDDIANPGGGFQIDRARRMNITLDITPFTYNPSSIVAPTNAIINIANTP